VVAKNKCVVFDTKYLSVTGLCAVDGSLIENI
jgi:hypothetical protein